MSGRRCLTCVVAAGAAAALSALWAGGASAELQRTVNGPSRVTPGETYTFDVSGFVPGERIYATVQPVACAKRSERCEQDVCPSCSPARIGSDGAATIRFRWPAASLRAIANMDFDHPAWQPGSAALVRIDLASQVAPKGCERVLSMTANPDAGSIVCAATLTRIG